MQVWPDPEYPVLQTHVQVPARLVQKALASQSCKPMVHSSVSDKKVNNLTCENNSVGMHLIGSLIQFRRKALGSHSWHRWQYSLFTVFTRMSKLITRAVLSCACVSRFACTFPGPGRIGADSVRITIMC